MQKDLSKFAKFVIGQRWISEPELNLGLGIVRQIKDRRVEIFYPASDCTRLYAIASAPLRRVEFKPGDTVESREGSIFVVVSVNEKNGIFIYVGKDVQLAENELKDSLSFTSPKDRFNNRLFDPNVDFNLRYRSFLLQNEMRKSPVRGFIGGRIDLIAHQLYIAHEVSSRYNPRVLLSDETGLGKTIEACLILHRLLITERIQRVLILVPDSLVHQWFVELLRKFNLIFKIVDMGIIRSLRESSRESKTFPDDHYTGNFFQDDQLFLCNIDLLTFDDELQKQALDAPWDMIVIDEAHHLVENGPQYLLAKNLGQKSKGLMLITATPEQFGFKSHFARLHLLDPSRYFNYEIFQKEEQQYLEIARILDKLVNKESLSQPDIHTLHQHSLEYSPDSPLSIMEDLLDRLGTGRAVFQNTRSVMKGFPERKVHLVPLLATEDDLINQTLEFHADVQPGFEPGDEHKPAETLKENCFNFKNDKRIEWLTTLIKTAEQKKILVICRSKEKAKAVEEGLRNLLKIETALFHEDLSLLQRDQNASRFADEGGVRVLICSEIGSEGRNFQFAHNLVMFDLPFNPELLEQRIGRLDRIGQKETIHIHVPCLVGGEYEILARWYHEGLNAFNRNIPGIHVIFEAMKDKLKEIIFQKTFHTLNDMILLTKNYSEETAQKFKKGKDHLLELNSFRDDVAGRLISQIQNVDHSRETEELMLDIFESYGIEEDFISEKTYRLNLSMLTTGQFPLPVLRKDDLVVTFDRKTAVSHEHMEFVSRDHPLVGGALEFLLASEKGNCCLAILQNKAGQTILLESIFVLECIAVKGLFINRFLPPAPIRVIVNHQQENCEKIYSPEFLSQNLINGNRAKILNNPQFKRELFPAMLKQCETLADAKTQDMRKTADDLMQNQMKIEINRLVNLQKINPDIQDDEIEKCAQEQKLLGKTIRDSRLRLDSLRLILSEDLAD